MTALEDLVENESARRHAFPVCTRKIFLAHAAIAPLPRVVADAMSDYVRAASEDQQEFGDVLERMVETRSLAARLIGAERDEIALLGPTSLGLSLIARGLDWQAGDEVVCYGDDYPANVYPWLDLARLGVVVRWLKPETTGEITPDLVASVLTARTRLVALASCHFITGFRIDHDAIGRMLRERGVLFSVDGIQTLGAFPLSVEQVDFMSADSHKWLLGPQAAGIFYVRKSCFDLLRPSLIGAWNVRFSNFIAQDRIAFYPTARRYEPGVLNVAGLIGMKAALEMILTFGVDAIATRVSALKAALLTRLESLGCKILRPVSGPNTSGITTFSHPGVQSEKLFAALEKERVVASLRHDRAGGVYVRLSPHFYNTLAEIEAVASIVQREIAR